MLMLQGVGKNLEQIMAKLTEYTHQRRRNKQAVTSCFLVKWWVEKDKTSYIGNYCLEVCALPGPENLVGNLINVKCHTQQIGRKAIAVAEGGLHLEEEKNYLVGSVGEIASFVDSRGTTLRAHIVAMNNYRSAQIEKKYPPRKT